MFENVVKKAVNEKGESDRGTRNGYSILIELYQKQINLLYSRGDNIELIEDCYRKLLFYYSKMWDRKYGYIELIKVLSLAVLFDVGKGEIFELEKRIVSKNFDDYLVNVLIKRIDSAWTNRGKDFEFKGVYDCLRPILDDGENQDCERLREYLQQKWYEIHRECAWYDSHKSNKSVYHGYWSFEARAIAKVFNLDDDVLENISYYPYELVHYK